MSANSTWFNIIRDWSPILCFRTLSQIAINSTPTIRDPHSCTPTTLWRPEGCVANKTEPSYAPNEYVTSCNQRATIPAVDWREARFQRAYVHPETHRAKRVASVGETLAYQHGVLYAPSTRKMDPHGQFGTFRQGVFSEREYASANHEWWKFLQCTEHIFQTCFIYLVNKLWFDINSHREFISDPTPLIHQFTLSFSLSWGNRSLAKLIQHTPKFKNTHTHTRKHQITNVHTRALRGKNVDMVFMCAVQFSVDVFFGTVIIVLGMIFLRRVAWNALMATRYRWHIQYARVHNRGVALLSYAVLNENHTD